MKDNIIIRINTLILTYLYKLVNTSLGQELNNPKASYINPIYTHIHQRQVNPYILNHNTNIRSQMHSLHQPLLHTHSSTPNKSVSLTSELSLILNYTIPLNTTSAPLPTTIVYPRYPFTKKKPTSFSLNYFIYNCMCTNNKLFTKVKSQNYAKTGLTSDLVN